MKRTKRSFKNAWLSLLAVSLLLVQPMSAWAQPSSFCRTLITAGDSVNNVELVEVIASDNFKFSGEYAVVGWRDFPGTDSMNTLVGKLDKEGRLTWMREANFFPNVAGVRERGRTIIEATNDDLIVGSNSTFTPSKAFALARYNATGTLLGAVRVNNHQITEIFELTPDSVIVFGTNLNDLPVALLFDGAGVFLSATRLGIPVSMDLNAVVRTSDGGFAGVGTELATDDVVVFKLFSNLNIAWIRSRVAGAFSINTADIVEDNLGRIRIAGDITSATPLATPKIFLSLFNGTTGTNINNIQISRQTSGLRATDLLITDDDGLLLGGDIIVGGVPQMYTTKFGGSAGNFSTDHFGTNSTIGSVVDGVDGGFLIVGGSTNTPLDSTGKIIQIDESGLGCCSNTVLDSTAMITIPYFTIPTVARTPYTPINFVVGTDNRFGTIVDVCPAPIFKSEPNTTDVTEWTDKIRVYPNPADREVTLELGVIDEASAISLLDVQGRTVRTWQTNQPRLTLNLEDLPAGLYLIQVTQNERKASSRLVLRH